MYLILIFTLLYFTACPTRTQTTFNRIEILGTRTTYKITVIEKKKVVLLNKKIKTYEIFP